MDKYDFLKNAYNKNPKQVGSRMGMPISGKYGSCMSLHNLDKLDQDSLNYVQELIDSKITLPFYIADIGASPYCPQSLRFASLGIHVDAFDLESMAQEVTGIANNLPGQVEYSKMNLLEANTASFKHQYHIVYSNRCFLFLPYSKARNLLELLIDKMLPKARCYLSLGNIESDDTVSYFDHDKPLSKRFSIVDGEVLKQAGVNAPVCLYYLNEVKEKLLKGLPITVLWLEKVTNNLNSIKLIFEKN